MYFLKNLLLYSGAWFRQTKWFVMMTKEGSTTIENFMIPGAGFLVLGCGHISHKAKMPYKRLWCCFPVPSLIFIYSMMGLLIYKYEPLLQEVSVKSLILRWPLRPVGLLFIIHLWKCFQYDVQEIKTATFSQLMNKQTISKRIVFNYTPCEKFHVLSDASFDFLQFDWLNVSSALVTLKDSNTTIRVVKYQ